MSELLDAVRAGATADVLASLPMPTSTRAVFVRRQDADMFAGVASDDKDPRKSIHVGEVPLPEIAPDEVYLAALRV
jgi:crotonyl-CoA reductase